jgi:replication factor C subunit 1
LLVVEVVNDCLIDFFSFCHLSLGVKIETTTATLVAKEAGRDVLEFNASDGRSKKAIQESLGDMTGSQAISFGTAKSTSTLSRTKRCIIMDEVDGMGGGDRGGIAELIQVIRRSQVPIICICNDRQSQKIKSLLPYCLDLRYRRPVKSMIARRAMTIAAEEGFPVELNAAEAIAESCGNDIRQVVNALQMWASEGNRNRHTKSNGVGGTVMSYKDLKDREHSINKDSILRMSLFDASRVILEGRKGLIQSDTQTERDSFFQRNDAFFVDYSFVPLIVQQNYLKIAQGSFLAAERNKDDKSIQDALERTALAAESMSDFTCTEGVLRGGEQNWSLLPFMGALTVKTGFHAAGPSGGFLQGFPEFTTWLGRNSSKGRKIRLLQELKHHVNYKISGSGSELRLSYLPVLRDRFYALINSKENEDLDKALQMMDWYGLDRDDIFETLDEFYLALSKNAANSFGNIESKQKAAFTRAYNLRSHMNQALVAEQGATKNKRKIGNSGGETFGEPIDPDAIDDDDQLPEGENDEAEDEDDFEKIKSLFKRKTSGRGSTGTKATTSGKGRKRTNA